MIVKLSRRTLIVAVVLAVTVAGLGAGTAYAYTGEVPRGTAVRGIDIGGMSRSQAEVTLTEGLAEQADVLAAPLTVRVGDQTVELDPAEVGLAVDVPATVARAARGRNPVRTVLSPVVGPREVEPVVVADPALVDAALQELAQDAGETMTMPGIRFEELEPVPAYPEPGLGLDPELAAELLAAAWLPPAPASGVWRAPPVVAVPLVEITPVTTADDVDRLLAELARPAVAAPVTVTVPAAPDGTELTAAPEVIAGSLRLAADERGEIVPAVDPDALREGLADQLAAVETPPEDARFTISGGSPEIVAGTDGEVVDLAGLADELLAVLAQPAPRSVAADMTTAGPEIGEAELAGLGVDQQVSTFTTNLTESLSAPRTQNIALISEMVTGTLVRPGETFSLNGHTGERGYEQGFQDAAVIIGGRLQPAVGGGLSQFTTTLFNAAFYAGLEIVEHQPHSFHYSRYPSVLESTIFYPTIDFKFHNDSGHGILIQTTVTEGAVTVSLWGTPVWDDVTAEWSDRRNFTQPRQMYVDPGPSCLDTQGIQGFTQDAWRLFHRDGEVVEREQFTWRYDAQPEVICGEEPDE